MEKLKKLKTFFLPKYEHFLDTVIRRELPFWAKLLELIAIRFLYLCLTVLVLYYEKYTGGGTYDIVCVWWKDLIAFGVFVGMSALFLKLNNPKRFAGLLMHMLYILYYIPMNVTFGLHDTNWEFFILSTVYFLLLILVVVGLSKIKWPKKKTEPALSADNHPPIFENKLLNLFCFLICALFILHKLMYNGLELSFNEDMYANRAAYSEYLTSIGGSPFSYALAIVRNLASFVAPFYLLVGLLRRKPFPVIVGALCALSMYAVSSEKAQLLMPVVTVAIFILYKMKLLDNLERVFTIGIIALLLICYLQRFLLGSNTIYIYLVRREMFLPAWINSLYYDFFSENSKVMWSQNVFLFQNILDPVYDTSVLTLISNAFFNGEVPSPNTGMFAEAYMHFGVVGVFVYPALLGTLIAVSGKVFSGFGEAVRLYVVIKLILSFTNVPITRTDFVLSYILFAAAVLVISLIRLPHPADKLKTKKPDR